ncbi:MAG: hypothetical protein LBO66_12670 [Deltaproteobacteria bacterium]|jgi:hypothetical protein|nr:hypothetical protein [Deltaproteobacteria bacterium]
MTVISKIIEITEDRRLRLDLELPDDLPTGKAELRLTINPLRPIPAHKPFEGLFGVLKNKKSFDGDGVDSRRQWRDEWPE